MDPLDQVISPLVRSIVWYTTILFACWAFGFEFVAIILLALIAKTMI
jgi:hypothetical protein